MARHTALTAACIVQSRGSRLGVSESHQNTSAPIVPPTVGRAKTARRNRWRRARAGRRPVVSLMPCRSCWRAARQSRGRASQRSTTARSPKISTPSESMGSRPHSTRKSVEAGAAHRRVALRVAALDPVHAVVSVERPLALGVRAVEVQRAADVEPVLAAERDRGHDDEQLVDAVDRHLRVDRCRGAGRLLDVPAVDRRLVGLAARPEGGYLGLAGEVPGRRRWVRPLRRHRR